MCEGPSPRSPVACEWQAGRGGTAPESPHPVRTDRRLRHTGNQLAADMGVSTKNLMGRMGHDNERAALRYQHRSAKGDRIIADGLDALSGRNATRTTKMTARRPGRWCSWPNGPLMAHR